MTMLWLRGLLRKRPARLCGAALGIAITVAMLASLGAFLAHAKATMTHRAAHTVSVDWQVQVQPGSDPAAIQHLVATSSGVTHTAQVSFAATSGLSAVTGTSTQTTGAGVVLGLPADYSALFPGEIRHLVGARSGVLLAQQTAANLHAQPGDEIQIGRVGLPPATVTVAGVVDLPHANALFQKVGAPATMQPAAPPDNVVLMPTGQWHTLFAPIAGARPDLVSTQIHAARNHLLPADPSAAYTAVTGAAHNLQARSAGGAVVGDNLAAALGAARSDAAYAQALFLFLGVPGAVLAALLTATITAAGAPRRRVEQALLRARGASGRHLMRLSMAEAGCVGITGSAVGIGVAALIGQMAFGTPRFGNTGAVAAGWAAAAAATGIAVAAAAILIPARREQKTSTVAAGRAVMGRLSYPTWARYGLDAVVLILAGLVFNATSGNGYQLVFAPEGAPQISVSYWAFAGPSLLWCGAALLTWRLVDLALGPGRRLLTMVIRPATGSLAVPIAAGISRRRRPLTRAIVLLMLAVAFAVSTATFNTTYRQQAAVDAQLSNGADVTVTPSPGAHVPPSEATALAKVPGVHAVQPIQHRFAYVGTDLQDLYGVNPATITQATALQNTYFQGGSVNSLMHTMATRPDSILVSAETVSTYQLQRGDPITLRINDAHTHQYKQVHFRYIGIVKEFPTAPKDSFFVANASYITQATGSDAVGAFLVNTGGHDTTGVARRVEHLLGPSAKVTDIAATQHAVGSSLTAVDLAGLTRVELSFALVLAVASGGLVLALGLAERRRTFAIISALGAKPRHLRRIVLSETAVLTAAGIAAGAVTGAILSGMLVTVLSGVFDPPPSAVAVPWAYLTTVGGATAAALVAVGLGAIRAARRPPVPILRDL